MESPESQTNFYAHTLEDEPKEKWEPLFTPFGKSADQCQGKNSNFCQSCHDMEPQHGHLNKVAYWAGKFASEMFPEGEDSEAARQWGCLAGLWHDLGKFSIEFQNYLFKATDIHNDEILERIDHTSAGAKLASNKTPFPLGHCIATAIAGHHSGLLDARSENACLEKRLDKKIHDISSAPSEILDHTLPPLPTFIKPDSTDFSISFYQRMLFSCLVDADFLGTEAFMNAHQANLRPDNKPSVFKDALTLLNKKIKSFGVPDQNDAVNIARASVFRDCLCEAEKKSGIFSLTVPTGGGKTLSSLAFALKHAIKHGHRRIIYVIPFTSIIEQNAEVFSDLLAELGENIVLEHHSNLNPDKESTRSRLATENWDAAIIVTTSVQFYESLFAAKTSKNRKLHNIANSVVILDEAQALPVQFLDPCLRALEQLSEYYHTTTVLCTATQPAVNKSEDFPIGISGICEIISDTDFLFSSLKRVNLTYRNTLDDKTIAEEMEREHQALCIVNTRNHAQILFQLLPEHKGNYHLSALMCPEHRLQILKTVRERLDGDLPTRLISTQLIEAGVDIDFPTVYRSMAGLDAIAQAAGRCNRNGKQQTGNVHVFHSEHTRSEIYFQETTNVGHQILDLYKNDPLSTEAIQAYFNQYYYYQKTNWDSEQILDDFKFSPNDKKIPFLFSYKTAASKFKLIKNQQIPIIIPWNDAAKGLCEQLRNPSITLHRELFRSLQRYTVQIYDSQFYKNQHQFESVRDGDFHILICPETHYSDKFGLNLTGEAANVNTLIC